MKELIAGILAVGTVLYLLRDEKAPSFNRKIEGFEPEILQNTLNKIQETEKSIYPIDTVYFNKKEDGTGYMGRFMFLNTDGFYGVQYDVETDGSTLTSVKKMVPPEYQNPFSGFSEKQPFSDMKSPAPFVDMQKIYENFRVKEVL